jgi:hypothetical protein
MGSPVSPPHALGKKINFNVSTRAYDELADLARQTKRSMTEIIRLGISLAKIAIEAERAGHKLVVTKSDGTPLKELVLPS